VDLDGNLRMAESGAIICTQDSNNLAMCIARALSMRSPQIEAGIMSILEMMKPTPIMANKDHCWR